MRWVQGLNPLGDVLGQVPLDPTSPLLQVRNSQFLLPLHCVVSSTEPRMKPRSCTQGGHCRGKTDSGTTLDAHACKDARPPERPWELRAAPHTPASPSPDPLRQQKHLEPNVGAIELSCLNFFFFSLVSKRIRFAL